MTAAVIRARAQAVCAELRAVDDANAVAQAARAKLRASYTELQKLNAELGAFETKEESDG